MKLNQATAAAAVLSTINLASSSVDSARDELKDKIAPLLASMSNRYLLRNRMLQSRSECVADYNALRCQSVSNATVGETTTFGVLDASPCDASLLEEECAADYGVVGKYHDFNVNCTFLNGELQGHSLEYIYTSLLLCFPASCFSELFKGEAVETLLSVMVANHNDYEADDVECKMSNSAGKSTGMLALAATAAAAALVFF